MHWRDLGLALYPDALGAIFSGSAVYDRDNTSGLGTAGNPPLVVLFTHHDHAGELAGTRNFQNQSLAYSLDKGRTFTKYSGNPVLANPGLRDFRDPKISWFAANKQWIMTLATGDAVSFYSSPDLKTWRHESDFGRGEGEHRGVWECPDLIAITVRGESTRKFLLLVSVNPGGPNGGTATQYFVGDFDGHRFTLDAEPQGALRGLAPTRAVMPSASSPPRWVDYGTDDYAGVTWANLPAAAGRQIFLGWMSNWSYALNVPTAGWRSAMTLPRELHLVRTASGLELHSLPIRELEQLRGRRVRLGPSIVRGELRLTQNLHSHSGLLELDLRLDAGAADAVALDFGNAAGERVTFTIDRKRKRYALDRSKSGSVDFNAHFGDPQFAPLRNPSTSTSLRIFVDTASLELFIDDGETVMTAIDFPSIPFDRVTLRADRPIELQSADIYALESIWSP